MPEAAVPALRVNAALLRLDTVRRGWTGARLAARAKVSQMTVSRVFRGQACTPGTLRKLARALGHDIDRYLILPAFARARGTFTTGGAS
jgi:transcriptional regulator with XRE-family HTH domain